MALSYMKAIEYLEELDASTMRFSDVVQITRLHMEAIDKFGSADEGQREDDWTEDDDAAIADILKELDAEETGDEGSGDGEENTEENENRDE